MPFASLKDNISMIIATTNDTILEPAVVKLIPAPEAFCVINVDILLIIPLKVLAIS